MGVFIQLKESGPCEKGNVGSQESWFWPTLLLGSRVALDGSLEPFLASFAERWAGLCRVLGPLKGHSEEQLQQGWGGRPPALLSPSPLPLSACSPTLSGHPWKRFRLSEIMTSHWTFIFLILLQHIIPVENWKIQINNASLCLWIKILLARDDLHSYVPIYDFLSMQTHIC